MNIKGKSEKKYYIQSKNNHLMNLLEKDYYIELGVIDIDIFEKLLNGEKIEFSKLINIDLLSDIIYDFLILKAKKTYVLYIFYPQSDLS